MPRRQEHSAVSRRLAYAVISVVFANYLGNAFLYVLEAGATTARVVTSLALLFSIAYLQLGVFSRPGTDLRSGRARLALGALAVLVFAPVPFFPTAWGGMGVFLAGSVLLVVPGRVRWIVFVAAALANPASKISFGIPPSVMAYYAASSLTAGLAVYGLSRLPTLVHQLETTRSELADLAVARERLAFARDLQDLLGVGLATITLKAGLAGRLIGERTGRAAEELARIIDLSRQALADVRAVASSYRALSPADELEAARSALTADRPEPSPRSAAPPARQPFLAGPPIPTRFARALLTAVVIGYGVMATLLAAYYLPVIGLGAVAVCALSGAVTAVLVLGFVSRPGVRPAPRWAAFAGIAVCVYLPQFAYGHPYLGGVPGFLAGAAVLLLPRWAGWTAFAAVVAGQGVLQAVWGFPASDVVWALMATTNHGLVLYALTRLRSMVTELRAAQEELATAAVTRERLRFARDLHDLLGFSLSAITLKCELAHRLAAPDPVRARRELGEVAEISRQALADVRSVALSYRELSLDEETWSAQALLSAADIEVVARIDAYDELPAATKVALATVLREGVTNLLRHSKAEHCEILLSTSPQSVEMELTNDGIPATAPGPGDGSGIGNLATRVRALGGVLHAGLTPEHTYRLRAEIPLGHSISMTAQPQL
ncbi:histidine kinase [Lentzea sp. NPDC003310]|uniref:sensor histidine kinase n=1 Tax=Lentzea sp. NPDC003310 TaxID=3154447 RepID=UPI0033B7AD10